MESKDYVFIIQFSIGLAYLNWQKHVTSHLNVL